jgi:hypothetical protein
MFDYAKSLFDKFGSKHTACLIFKHVPYFLESKSFHEFVAKLRLVYKFKSSGYIDYQVSGNKKKTFLVNPNDIQYVKDLLHDYDRVECMKKKFGLSSILNHTIGNFFGFFSKIRMGKTIYKTDFVETINQHSADFLSAGAKKVDVPIDLGFSSHVRNYVTGLFDTDIDPIRYLIFDAELFLSTTLPFDSKCHN